MEGRLVVSKGQDTICLGTRVGSNIRSLFLTADTRVHY